MLIARTIRKGIANDYCLRKLQDKVKYIQMPPSLTPV